MTIEEFNKKRFKAFEQIEYTVPSIGVTMVCMLVALNFEEKLLLLRPFPGDIYEDEDFWVRCEHCKRPYPKPKVSK